MKNIFKKAGQKQSIANISRKVSKLNEKQTKQVMGGDGGPTPTNNNVSAANITTSRSNTQHN